MSLFGEESSGLARNPSSSLFDDDPSTTPKKKPSNASGGLFADEDEHHNESSSPWGSGFTPKKQARSDVLKTLLPGNAVPEIYIDTFDALVEEGFVEGSGANKAGVQKLLEGSKLSSSDRGKILVITGAGSWDKTSFAKPEINVLLALIGLAQEGEEVSLDSVDERRQSLPVPQLPALRAEKTTVPPVRAEHPNPSTSVNTSMDNSKLSTSDDQDPWGSPTNTFRTKPSANSDMEDTLTNGSAPRRTTSSFSTAAAGEAQETVKPPASSRSAGEWGGSDFDGGFSGAAAPSASSARNAGSTGPSSSSRPQRSSARRQVSHGAQEILSVNALPEKEGVFLFQYRNYEVSSNRKSTNVIRRYSDFVWLLDCLHKRYPFRQLPLLPPKRVSINGNHLAAETQFLEKRRRGLARFVNALIQHPVLREEQLVTMFLTVPTELAAWRKQAQLTIQEEFVGRSLPPNLEDSLPPTLEDLFAAVRAGVRRSAELYINMCSLLERQLKRREGLSSEYSRLSSNLQSLTEASNETYHIDTNDVPLLNEGLSATAKHISEHQALLTQESAAWDEGVLEDLKKQRDALVSMRDLFDRRDRYDKDNIPTLEKRIAGNEAKLEGVRSKPEGTRKAGEAEKLEDAIHRDKQSIVDQHARSIFVKECIRDEIQFFLQSLYHVSRTCQDWAGELVRSAEQTLENWREFEGAVENMPVQGSS